MTSEDREKIISNDYADLIINYSGDTSVFNKFKDATVQIINNYYAVVYVPVSQITEKTIVEQGYSAIPLLFGLVSQASLEASGIIRIRNIPNFNLRGQGVLIGIIDSGIDYTNPIFQYVDKTTKILSIWDQTIVSENFPKDFYYGTEYTRDQINEALKSGAPLEMVPSTDTNGHGTMLAGIAAGNEVPESGFYGVAPEAEIVVVKLKQAKDYLRSFFGINENVACYQENDIQFGLGYLVEAAQKVNRPIAICIAVDTSQYAHDGRGNTSSILSIQAGHTGIAVLLAAGNEGNARRHYYGTVDPIAGYDTVELNIGDNEGDFFMEFWGDSPSTFSIDITTPTGEYIPRIVSTLDENRVVSFIFEKTILYIDYQMVESQSGDQLILVRFRNPAPGIWRFNVYGRGDLGLGFHIWLPMAGFISDNTYFIRSNPYTTLLSLACAREPITVTAYNPEDDSLYMNSSRGNTRIDVIKPDIAAPGVNIISPALDQSFTEVSGTSAAVAHTTGVAAMLLEWGIVKKHLPVIDGLDIKIL